jgi:hypothetical protein
MMSDATVNYIEIAVPGAVLVLGGLICCMWRSLYYRIGELEERYHAPVQPQQQAQLHYISPYPGGGVYMTD